MTLETTQETTQDITQSIEACASHYGQDADAVRDYLIQGQQARPGPTQPRAYSL